MFPHARFQTKMVLSFSFILLLVIASFLVFLHYNLFPNLQDDIRSSNRELCVKTSEGLEDYIQKIDDITKKLISNQDLLQILRKAKAGETFNEYEKLNNNRKLSAFIANTIALTSLSSLNINVFSEDGDDIFIYNRNESNLDAVLQNPQCREELEQRRLLLYFHEPEKAEEPYSVSFIRPFYDVYFRKYGYIEVEESDKYLRELCSIGSLGDVILTDKSGRILYATAGLEESVQELLSENLPETTEFADTAGNQYFCTPSERRDLVTCIRYNPAMLYSSLDLLKQATALMIAAVLFVSLALMFFFTRLLLSPLHKLRDNVLQINYKNMGMQELSTDNDEIVMLGHAFQEILAKLKLSMEHKIASNKAEAEARLLAMQAQIAPHFIHNVLYTISIAAQESRTEDVVSMCKQLSDMLRYTVNSSSHTVQLEEEISCIDNYLALQAHNYEEFLEYGLSVNQETKRLPMPRLSLQPFVENIFQHAFRNSQPPYRIFLFSTVQGERWRISISDNGCGIRPAETEKIEKAVQQREYAAERGERSAQGMCGMGTVNAICRLHALYGDSFSWSIRRNQEGGTTVCLEGPLPPREGERTAPAAPNPAVTQPEEGLLLGT